MTHFLICAFALVINNNYGLAGETGKSSSKIWHMVAGIASDSCGEFYEKYKPQIEDYYHIRTIFFIEGFLTAYNYQEALHNKNHISSIGQSTDETSIALMMHNYCLKYPADRVSNAITNTVINLKEIEN
nr:hypothetical protein [Acetobacter malorum]